MCKAFLRTIDELHGVFGLHATELAILRVAHEILQSEMSFAEAEFDSSVQALRARASNFEEKLAESHEVGTSMELEINDARASCSVLRDEAQESL